MSAKKAAKNVIFMGIHKGEVVTITKKKAPEGYVVVKVSGQEITISKSLIK